MEKFKCDVCGKYVTEEDSVVCNSAFGPCSFRYCAKCHADGLEPYDHIVSYIACAGYFPDDINEEYQKFVRNILIKLGKSEEDFIEDVKDRVEEYDDMLSYQKISTDTDNIENIEDEFEDF